MRNNRKIEAVSVPSVSKVLVIKKILIKTWQNKFIKIYFESVKKTERISCSSLSLSLFKEYIFHSEIIFLSSCLQIITRCLRDKIGKSKLKELLWQKNPQRSISTNSIYTANLHNFFTAYNDE